MTVPASRNPPPSDTLDIRAYLRPIWRRKWIVLAIAVLAGAATYYVSSREAKRYIATASLYVSNANPVGVLEGQAATPPSGPDLVNDAFLITSQPNTDSVYTRLRLPASGANTVSAVPQASGSSVIEVTATTGSPALAAELANTYALQFIRSQSSQLLAQARSLVVQDKITLRNLPHSSSAAPTRYLLEQQLTTLYAAEAHPSPGLELQDAAVAPTLPSSPDPKRDTIFGVIIGLVLGIAVAFGLELLDRRLTLVSTIESLFERPVLAVLPHAADPTPTADGQPAIAPEFVEAMRALMVSIDLEESEGTSRTILVTSALPSEGKSTVTRGLALAYAEAGRTVLLIDADLRRPIMSSSFGLKADPGLLQVLHGEVSLADAARPILPPKVATAPSNGKAAGHAAKQPSAGLLSVLTHGERTSNPVALLSLASWEVELAIASASYDVVIIDSAPVLTVADTIWLLEQVDKVVLVARLGMTTRESATRIRALFRRMPTANLIGVVANDMHEQFFDEGYGTYYGAYAYTAPTNGSAVPVRRGKFTRS
jgi:Mrp family chromosome partitioning ATPase/capsular polysaccharide biosynthesis protein